MMVPDEVVIEALLKDAKKFKSKWELHTGEPTRSKPNVVFLKRTLSNVVKVNEDRMRKPRNVESEDSHSSNDEKQPDSKKSSDSEEASDSRSRSSKRSKKSGCSKSKYRSPESRSKSKKSSKRKRDSSPVKSRRFPKR